MAPRAALWVYSVLLASVALMVLGLSVFLVLYLAPYSVVGGLGAICAHGSYCPQTLPTWVQYTLWLSVTALVLWLAARMAWATFAALRASRRVRRAVLASATPISAGGSIRVLEIADPAVFACTLGFWSPLILLSRGLRESLSPSELEVVLGHEAAHAAGRDNLILLVATVVEKAFSFVPGVSQAHVGVRRCAEIAADAAASAESGDRLLVAASVSHVARLLFDSAAPRPSKIQPTGAAFAHNELLVERVQRLVDGRRSAPSRRRLLCGVAALVLVLSVFSTSMYVVTGNSLTGAQGSATCSETISW